MHAPAIAWRMSDVEEEAEAEPDGEEEAELEEDAEADVSGFRCKKR